MKGTLVINQCSFVGKLSKKKQTHTTGLDNIFVEWFRQDYGITKYALSAVGLAAGAAILKNSGGAGVNRGGGWGERPVMSSTMPHIKASTFL